jgi:hypothetical protein
MKGAISPVCFTITNFQYLFLCRVNSVVIQKLCLSFRYTIYIFPLAFPVHSVRCYVAED